MTNNDSMLPSGGHDLRSLYRRAAARLSELGCEKSIIDKAAQDAVLNPMKLQSCPRPVSPDNAAEIISGILSKAW